MASPTQSPSAVLPFGNYLLDELIAEGGMARVYRARLRGLGGFEKVLVVKQIRPELARDPRFVRMFVEEAKTLVQLSHPHIVPVYELGVVDGVYFLSMEHVDGVTLADMVREGGALPPAILAHLGAQIADALHYAHERFALVHRDVTPRNVLIDSTGNVRLVDFGIAAPMGGDADPAGATYGSPGYMAPEQIEGRPPSPRTDLFGLGAVLFFAATGAHAFWRGDRERSEEATFAGLGDRLEREAPDLPASLARSIEECLHFEAESRPESALALGARLRSFAAAERPEGAAAELAQRARTALFARRLEHEKEPSSGIQQTPPPSSGGTVQTLATSAVLSELFGDEGSPSEGRAGGASERPTESPRARSTNPARSAPDRAPTTEPLPRTDPLPGTGPLPLESTASGDGNGEPPSPVDGSAPGAETNGSRDPTATRDDQGRILGRRWAVSALALAMAVAAGAITTAWWLAPSASSDPEPAGGHATGPPESAPAVPTPEPEEAPPEELAAQRSASARAEGRVERRAAGPRGEALDREPRASEERVRGEAEGDSRSSPSRGHEAATDAQLTVNATPWATVRVDGRSVGNTPRRGLALRPGRHTISLECPPLGRSVSVPLHVEAGETVRVLADLTSDPPRITVR